jgi:hypothetical protein
MPSPELTARLTRSHQGLMAQTSEAGFLRRIAPYLEDLAETEPAQRVLRELKREAEGQAFAFETDVVGTIARLREARAEFVRIVPEAEDAHVAAPPEDSDEHAQWTRSSLGYFDELCALRFTARFPLVPVDDHPDPTAVPRMISVLLSRIDTWRPEYEEVGRVVTEVWNIQETHRASVDVFHQAGYTLAGVAHARLTEVRDGLMPAPVLRGIDEDEDHFLTKATSAVFEELAPLGIARRAANGRSLDPDESRFLSEMVAFLRSEADRLHRDLLDRIDEGERITLADTARRLASRFSGWAVAAVGTIVVGIVIAVVAQHLTGSDGDGGSKSGSTHSSGPPPAVNGGYASKFMGETLPDGTKVPPSSQQTKSWTIENVGTRTWRGFTLRRTTTQTLTTVARIHVPTTPPGSQCVLRVSISTPSRAGVPGKLGALQRRGRLRVPGRGTPHTQVASRGVAAPARCRDRHTYGVAPGPMRSVTLAPSSPLTPAPDLETGLAATM